MKLLTKRGYLIVVIVIGLVGGALMMGSTTHAQSPELTCNGTASDPNCAIVCAGTKLSAANKIACKNYRVGKLGETANMLDSILSFLYLILRPLIYIAGLAMDNTLVYGEGLGLTGLLYQFWSIMRTIANFVIVFLLVYTIGINMFNPSQLKKDLIKAIGAILIGGVLINMSWFLIGAVIDISTISTYAVGTIPLKLSTGEEGYCDKNGKSLQAVTSMDDIKKLGNCRPLLSPHTTMNLSDTFSADQAKRKSYYKYEPNNKTTPDYYLTCPFVKGELRKDDWEQFVADYKQGVATLEDNKKETFTVDAEVIKHLNESYCVLSNSQLLSLQSFPIIRGTKAYNDSIVGGINHLHYGEGGMRVRSLVESNRGMIGVMYNMYGNMLGYAQLKTDIQTHSTESQIIQFLVKGFFGFAMIFPLIALCIVLVIRVAVLWVVIGFAPLLVLVRVTQAMGIKFLEKIAAPFKEKAKLSTIMSLMFQPVLVVFVVSIGTMFLDALVISMAVDNGFGEALQCVDQTATGEQCCKVVDFVDICFENFNAQVGTDAFFNYFTYAIVNIIGVLLLRGMVFAILKSNKITEQAAGTIQKMGRSYLGSLPVIPWGGGMVGYDGAKAGMGMIGEKITSPTEDATGKNTVQPSIDRWFDKWGGKESEARAFVSQAGDGIELQDIETTKGRKTMNTKLLENINKAKDEVKMATSDELLNRSDPKIRKLMDQYKANNGLQLLTNPQFIAESDSIRDASDALKYYTVAHKGRKGIKPTEQKFYREMIASIESKTTPLGENKDKRLVITQDEKIIYNYAVIKDDKSGEIKKVTYTQSSIPALKSKLSPGELTYEQIKQMEGKLTEKEFVNYVGSPSGGSPAKGTGRKTNGIDENKMIKIEQVSEPSPQPPSSETTKPASETTKPNQP